MVEIKNGYTYDWDKGIRITPTGKVQQIERVNNSINANTLSKNITPAKLPETTQPDYSNIQTEINNTLATAKIESDYDKQMQDLINRNTEYTSSIASLMGEVGQEEALTKKYAEQEGAYTAKKAYDEYVSQIEAEDLALRRETERIQKNLTGALASGVSSRIDETTRKSLSKQADLAILQNASARRYETAMSIAKDKVEMELAPKKAQLEGLKYIYDNNKAFQTAEYSSLLNRKEKELEQEQKDKDDSNAMILNAIQGKAPQSLISKAQALYNQGKSKTEIASILGNYGLSEADRLNNQLKQAQLKTEKLQQTKLLQEITPTTTGIPSVSQNTATTLLTNDKMKNALKLAVGTGLGRGLLRINKDRVDFVNNVENILNTLTLDTYAQAKAKGMTFGAMSEAEWNILASSATPIGNARVRSGDRVVGYKMSEQAMKDFLNTISNPESTYLDSVENALSVTNSPYAIYLNK